MITKRACCDGVGIKIKIIWYLFWYFWWRKLAKMLTRTLIHILCLRISNLFIFLSIALSSWLIFIYFYFILLPISSLCFIRFYIYDTKHDTFCRKVGQIWKKRESKVAVGLNLSLLIKKYKLFLFYHDFSMFSMISIFILIFQ